MVAKKLIVGDFNLLFSTMHRLPKPKFNRETCCVTQGSTALWIKWNQHTSIEYYIQWMQNALISEAHGTVPQTQHFKDMQHGVANTKILKCLFRS